MEEKISVWNKLDYSAASKEGGAFSFNPSEASQENSKKWKKWKPIWNFLALTFWAYIFVKVFIFDIDRYVVRSVTPDHEYLVDYRWVAYIVGAAVFFALIGKYTRGLLYVTFYPAILVFWKGPKFVYGFRSWIAVLCAINILTSVVGNIKYVSIFLALATLSTLAILQFDSWIIVAPGCLILSVIIIYSYYRNIRSSLEGSSFISTQKKVISGFLSSGMFSQLALISEELRDPSVEKFDNNQQSRFITSVGWGVLAHRATYYWAYQLELYRRSSVGVVFSGIAYLWIYIQTALGLALVNYGIYKINPLQFTTSSGNDTPLHFILYSMASLFTGNTSGLEPAGQIALLVKVFAGIIGPVLLVSLLTYLILSLRGERRKNEMGETITEIKKKGGELEEMLSENYEISLNSVLDRLKELNSFFVVWAAAISDRVPDDFKDEGSSSRG